MRLILFLAALLVAAKASVCFVESRDAPDAPASAHRLNQLINEACRRREELESVAAHVRFWGVALYGVVREIRGRAGRAARRLPGFAAFASVFLARSDASSRSGHVQWTSPKLGAGHMHAVYNF